MKRVLILSGAVVLAGCGGTTKTVTEQAPAPSTQAAAPPPATTAPKPASQECDALGINATERKEGACIEEGKKLRVVNRTTALQLNDLAVTNVSTEETPTLPGLDNPVKASGTFVKVNMTIRSRLSSPFTIDQNQFALIAGSATYSPDFDAMNNPGDSCIWDSKEIQPGNSTSCWVAFDVSNRNAPKVSSEGNLFVVQPSEDDYSNPAQRVGVVRLYDTQ